MAKRTDTDELVTRDGQPQRSHIDEDRLRTIAAQLGGTYLHRTGEGPIAPLPVAQAAQAPVGDDGGGHPLDWWLGGVAASLVVADLGLTARRTRLAKEDA